MKKVNFNWMTWIFTADYRRLVAAHTVFVKHLSPQLSWHHTGAHGRAVHYCLSVARAPPKSPVRFFRGAPKIYEMCLHVPLCKRGCRGGIARTEKAGGTHAFSLRESTLSKITDGECRFFFSRLPPTDRHSVGSRSRRMSFSPCPFLFLSPFCTAGSETDRSDCGSPPLCSDLLW